jgi:hypothetical protein
MSFVGGDVDGDVCGWSWLRRGSLDDWLCF